MGRLIRRIQALQGPFCLGRYDRIANISKEIMKQMTVATITCIVPKNMRMILLIGGWLLLAFSSCILKRAVAPSSEAVC